ncbi:MAG TPA: bifunctional demethylmenaquinone methyltransferase/2-methoxy-6-polyprenyl-1,4-benzoquinol methylase UbiE [Candidatus Sulfotelmatobacter sp.]|nr:bifunctional demethylmenaquinone methyltransferase/2-methoxy-6-polyprenyl-1,4-benzoquinol methylase UbiE [Candidatus Sulfotelmatobacter sp.]
MAEAQRPTVIGAAPEGAIDAHSAARAVREMFTSIAPRYDLLNHVLSCNVDRLWWRRTARTFAHIFARPDCCILDLCCGTGDMTFALRKQARKTGGKRSPQILGADFSHAMLQRARSKSFGKNGQNALAMPSWIEADALCLPFADQNFNLVTSAFGFRNLADYDAGLREIVRVLKPGGECGVLDFSEPKGLMGRLYRIYFKEVLPRVGTILSGVRGPYAYLPHSVERFPEPQEMLDRMRAAGFREASWTPYTFGIAGLYRGKR